MLTHDERRRTPNYRKSSPADLSVLGKIYDQPFLMHLGTTAGIHEMKLGVAISKTLTDTDTRDF